MTKFQKQTDIINSDYDTFRYICQLNPQSGEDYMDAHRTARSAIWVEGQGQGERAVRKEAKLVFGHKGAEQFNFCLGSESEEDTEPQSNEVQVEVGEVEEEVQKEVEDDEEQNEEVKDEEKEDP